MTGTTHDDDPGRSAGGETTEVLVRGVAAGNATSLERLVERLSPPLVAQARYRLGKVLLRHHDPEDLVNDAWLVALPRLHELARRGDAGTGTVLKFLSSTILFRVRNLARKHVRGRSAAADDLPMEVTAEQSGAVTRAVRAERASVVRDAIARLGEVDERIVILRAIEQQPNRAVAALLGLEEKTLSKRYHRALDRLRQSLPGSVFEELGSDGDPA